MPQNRLVDIMEKRILKEKDFHNNKIVKNTRAATKKYYSITTNSTKYYESNVLSNCMNKRVLEYGCGTGSLAFKLAEHGAEVVGIDVSEEAIENAKATAIKLGLSSSCLFKVMNAENLQFDDKYFDIVCGVAILHHLNLEKALAEITRVLKVEGKAYFTEPLGYNPFIGLYRRFTPRLRSEDEHPLRDADINLIKNSFDEANFRHFHLTTLIAMPLRNSKLFSFILTILEAVDRILFKSSCLRKQAWIIFMQLSNTKRL